MCVCVLCKCSSAANTWPFTVEFQFVVHALSHPQLGLCQCELVSRPECISASKHDVFFTFGNSYHLSSFHFAREINNIYIQFLGFGQ